jgi:hypothetical protein
MFRALHGRGWRAAVGLIASYALVLQAFLAYSLAAQAAAQEPSSQAGELFVLCASQGNPGAAHDDNAPLKPDAHCPTCTLCGSSAPTLPGTAALPAWQRVAAERTPFVSAAACISFHRARAGLSRAPPQNA